MSETPVQERIALPLSVEDYQLAGLGGQRPPMPEWAAHALAQSPERTMVPVDGINIEVLSWGARGKPGLLLFHGSRANADWWSFIAPQLMQDYRVVAFSMSGMGRSDRRTEYSLSYFAREAMAAAHFGGLFDAERKPILVAHSFGGLAALRTCAAANGQFGAIVLIDTIVPSLDNGGLSSRLPVAEPRRFYSTIDAALARFRLIPPRKTESVWALDEIGRRSLIQSADTGEWTWQFDNKLFARFVDEDQGDFRSINVPVAVIRGQDSGLYDQSVRQNVVDLFGTDVPDIVIPESGHHIMIDQPLVLIGALRTLLGAWPPSPGIDRRSKLGH